MTIAKAVAEMLKVWNTIEATARAQFPGASEERIYEITRDAMNHQLKAGK